MRTFTIALSIVLSVAARADAHGLLIPDDKKLPPLAMVYHRVNVAIDDQVAVTSVEQSFRNHTDRQLEATYLFAVPRGASVNRLTMFVDGREVAGELVEADKARKIYTDIVRRTEDPVLLEYIGASVLRLRVFPIAPKSDQKITFRYTSIAPQDAGVVEYVYPLKTDGKSTQTLQDFSVKIAIRTQQPLHAIYSPTHAISIARDGDRSAQVNFERNQAVLDKDFQLFYAAGKGDVGLTALTYRPISSEDGYFLFHINPRHETSSARIVPRDVALVLDTSGSMAGIKMDQAKKAIRYCLDQLKPGDRFAVLNFSTTVGKYREKLVEASAEHLDHARRWIDQLNASGGTAIYSALNETLAMRSTDSTRPYVVVFFTDGQPTIGETNPDKIVKRFATDNSANTRVFTFGVGDDVNATMLDQIAEQSRTVSTYVRPAEDIEAKTASLVTKISQPVLTNLKFVADGNVRLSEIYPPQLPDLFVGSQLVVLGRYSGWGSSTIRLTGSMGGDTREHTFEVMLPAQGGGDRDFVEHLWGRRKVGYLLDQIRANGEKKELVDEIVALSRRYGIATPYTSYLIVPDGAMPVARGLSSMSHVAATTRPLALRGLGGGIGGAAPAQSLGDYAKANAGRQLPKARDDLAGKSLESAQNSPQERTSAAQAASKKQAFDEAKAAFGLRRMSAVQTGKLGVDLSVESNLLRDQSRLTPSAVRNVAGRNCLEMGGVWIDEEFDPKMPTLTVKAQSEAYFRILERQPKMKDVFRLGNYLVWVAPNRTALIIDTTEGKEKVTDSEIDSLFAAKK